VASPWCSRCRAAVCPLPGHHHRTSFRALATSGDLENAGTIDLAPGILNVEGRCTQDTAGGLGVGIGGPAAGARCGQLDATGQTTLDGVLDLNLTGGFSPAPGTSSRILAFGSETGNF
jgi:hypothetical protein